ncbi:hypothetical protein M378DRAFT_131847 [Amanita muscaria Koide BX008]|uniref:NADP-dependent oxidoreductase domain-containing protein n=1 Tax=Amanita muscaria (strain Koide BX008) TaxID=946122 RepID=A0A0C2WQR8_AMAMK|nr:hypothetical protein M378DRAFT_131847 [Amanita muscaria Koide BX008]
MPFADFTLNDGRKIPSIAFGTGSVLKGTDVSEYVEQALETGFSHIDTAQYYETEESTGRAIRESGLDRSEIYVASKYSGGGEIQQAVRESLDKLGLRYLDLYLIHEPRAARGGFEAAWQEFEKIKKDGLSKSIGVSNFNLEQLQTLIKTANIKPAVNQILFHPYNYAEKKTLLEYAAQHNIVIEAYSSLTPITKLPGGPVDKVVKEAAAKRGVQPSQILLAWVRAKGVVIVTTSTKEQHLREYLGVADIEPLTAEEIAAIDEAGARKPWTSWASITVQTLFLYILGFLIGLGVMDLLLGLSGSRSSYK